MDENTNNMIPNNGNPSAPGNTTNPTVESEVIPPQQQMTADGGMYYSGSGTNTNNTSSNYYYNDTNPTSVATTEEFSTGFAIASLVMGILGFLSCCCCIGYLFDILGIVFFCLQKKNAEGKKPTMATVGLILSIVSIVLAIVLTVISLVSGNDYQSILNSYSSSL